MFLKKKRSEIEKLEYKIQVLSQRKHRKSFADKRYLDLRKVQQLFAKTQNIQQFIPLLLKYSDALPSVAVALGRLNGKTLDLLIEAMEDNNAMARAGACIALGENKDSQTDLVISILIRASSDRASNVRKTALQALYHSEPDQFNLRTVSIPLYLKAIEDDPDISIRREVLGWLIPTNVIGTRIFQAALEALRSKDSELQILALYLLARLRERQIQNELLDIVNNAEATPKIRRLAVYAVGHLMEENENQEFLIDLLKHNNSDVRYAAVMELDRIGNKNALSFLQEVYKNDKGVPTPPLNAVDPKTIKRAAHQAIASIKTPEHLEYLHRRAGHA